MGGQACILYGAAEFSRDIDFTAPASTDNLERLSAAMEVLDARRIAVPPFERRHLERGRDVEIIVKPKPKSRKERRASTPPTGCWPCIRWSS